MPLRWETYRIAGNFRGRKLSLISRIWCHSWKFSPQEGVAHFGLLCITSGLWQINEIFLREVLYFMDSWKFSPSKVSRYTVADDVNHRLTPTMAWLGLEINIDKEHPRILIPHHNWCLKPHTGSVMVEAASNGIATPIWSLIEAVLLCQIPTHGWHRKLHEWKKPSVIQDQLEQVYIYTWVN